MKIAVKEKYSNTQNNMLQQMFYVRMAFTRKVHAEIFQFHFFFRIVKWKRQF